jgi:hypothetical protein
MIIATITNITNIEKANIITKNTKNTKKCKKHIKHLNYRAIAKHITDETKIPMSFNGVRSIFLKTMKKMATDYIELYRPDYTGTKKIKLAEELAQSTAFQIAVGEYLGKFWNKEIKE